MVGNLVLGGTDLVEMGSWPTEEVWALLGDSVTVWDPMVVLPPVVVGVVPVKLWPTMGVGPMVPGAVEGKMLATVRSPGVNRVMLVLNSASGPEVGVRPVAKTIPPLRMSDRCVRGVFLSVVGAEEPERREL